MQESTSLAVISRYMTDNIRTAMKKCVNINNLTEIRLRSGRAVSLVYPDGNKFLTRSGNVSSSDRDCIISSAADIKQIVSSLSHYSIHSCGKELKNGYFVMENGVRVGISGVYSETGVINTFTGLNFRISREVRGCSDEIFRKLGFADILVCGKVNSGKTTVLRDLCRNYGNNYKVSLIDERNEISAVSFGRITNDVGIFTDILSGCSRADGINSALRTLSPDIIICDEISTESDADAILSANGCGIKFIASIHAENYESLRRREIFSRLGGIFQYAVFLGGSMSSIREIRRL